MSTTELEITRRGLRPLRLQQLRELAEQFHLPTTGTKSALIDRIYRHHRSTLPTERPGDGAPAETPLRSHENSPDAPPLDQRVQELVEKSLHGIEERILRALRPSTPVTAAVDNLSLPSPSAPHAPSERDQPSQPRPRTDAGTPAAQDQPLVQQPPVPTKIKQRILRGEFVDFDALLPEALYPIKHGASPSHSFSLRLSTDPTTDGDMVIAQPKPITRRTVRDLPSWLEAWNIYIALLVSQYPARAPSLLAYQRIICHASLHFSPTHWLKYDARFRACAAEDKTLRWDVKHNDLWLECFTHPATPSPQAPSSTSGKPATRRPCTYCGSLYHFPDNCPHNPFRPYRRPPNTHPTIKPSPTPQPNAVIHGLPAASPPPHIHASNICRDCNYNKVSCTRATCKFVHVCARCGDRTHGERSCPRSPTYKPTY